jgi:hypothetical protein
MKEYVPEIIETPRLIDTLSAWGNIPKILKDIIVRFNLKTDLALEIGVQTGYSTSALANYFRRVIGIDTFRMDLGNYIPKASEFYNVLKSLHEFPNIQLIETYWEDFIKQDFYDRYDLIHIDIIHNYIDTFDCGDWALQHSDCVIFHDTESYDGVLQAVTELSEKYSLEFLNYKYDNGLGILWNKK